MLMALAWQRDPISMSLWPLLLAVMAHTYGPFPLARAHDTLPLPRSNGTCTYKIALRHIFVITMAGSRRNSHIRETFHNAGLHPQLFVGADRTLINIAEVRRQGAGMRAASHQKKQVISAGEVAIALSHRNVMDHVILNRLPCAIVFESDIGIHSDFKAKFVALGDQLQSTAFDVLKLEYCKGEKFVPAGSNARHRIIKKDCEWACTFCLGKQTRPFLFYFLRRRRRGPCKHPSVGLHAPYS